MQCFVFEGFKNLRRILFYFTCKSVAMRANFEADSRTTSHYHKNGESFVILILASNPHVAAIASDAISRRHGEIKFISS